MGSRQGVAENRPRRIRLHTLLLRSTVQTLGDHSPSATVPDIAIRCTVNVRFPPSVPKIQKQKVVEGAPWLTIQGANQTVVLD